MPNHYVGDLLPTIGISGLSRVRTELLQLAVVMALAPHPVQMNRQLSRHRYFRDLSSSAHREVEELVAPLGLAAHRDLRRFHQQKAQQYVALFADVSQSTTISAGLFRRNQSYVAGDLFATVKTLRRSDYQLEGQRRQGSDSGMRRQAPRHRTFFHFFFQGTRQLLDFRRQSIE